MATKEDIERIENQVKALENKHVDCSAQVKTSITYLKWLIGGSMSMFIIIASTAWIKADSATGTMSTPTQVRFATSDEQYKQIQKDIVSLDAKIDDKFTQIKESLDELKKEKKNASHTHR